MGDHIPEPAPLATEARQTPSTEVLLAALLQQLDLQTNSTKQGASHDTQIAALQRQIDELLSQEENRSACALKPKKIDKTEVTPHPLNPSPSLPPNYTSSPSPSSPPNPQAWKWAYAANVDVYNARWEVNLAHSWDNRPLTPEEIMLRAYKWEAKHNSLIIGFNSSGYAMTRRVVVPVYYKPGSGLWVRVLLDDKWTFKPGHGVLPYNPEWHEHPAHCLGLPGVPIPHEPTCFDTIFVTNWNKPGIVMFDHCQHSHQLQNIYARPDMTLPWEGMWILTSALKG